MKKETARKLVRRQGEVTITTRSRVGDKNAEEIVTERRQVVDDLPEHPASIQVTGGLTKNLGNYESAKMSIAVSVPCASDDNTLRKTYKRISALVEELLDCEYERVVGEDRN